MCKIIAFSGCDKTGKTSIIRELHGITNYKHVLISRFVADNISFNILKMRQHDNNELFEIAKKTLATKKFIFVLVTCKQSVIKDRILSLNETDISVDDVLVHTIIFNKVFKKLRKFSKRNVVIFKNDYVSAFEAALALKKKLGL